MHIDDFGEQDVFVNIHGYDRWDIRSQVEEPVERISEEFPGKVFGVAEEGFEDELYGHEDMDLTIQSRPRSGKFDRRGLEIDDANYVVLSGGEYGACHHSSYEILRSEVDDAEFIFPPEACFGWVECKNPDLSSYTLDEFQRGTLPVNDQQYFGQKIIERREDLGDYDWGSSSIQPVKVD